MNDTELTRREETSILAVRLLDAPRELVFRAWTDPAHLAEWWGPDGFSLTTRRHAARTGGDWRFVMHGPDGRDYENLVTFLEVDPPSRLVYAHGGSKEVEPVNFKVEVLFEDVAGKTRLTMRMLFPSAKALDHVAETYGAFEGLKQTLGRLAFHLSLETGFRIDRTFDAPLELVWKAHTERDRLLAWWGVKGMKTSIARFALEPGGVFLYGMESPAGQRMWGRWVFREIVPRTRLAFVSSFSDPEGGVTRAPFFEDWPLEVLNVITFAEQDGRTTVTLRGGPVGATEGERARYRSHYDSMRGGFGATYDQLGEFLAGARGADAAGQ